MFLINLGAVIIVIIRNQEINLCNDSVANKIKWLNQVLNFSFACLNMRMFIIGKRSLIYIKILFCYKIQFLILILYFNMHVYF